MYGEASNPRHVGYERLRDKSEMLDEAIEPQVGKLSDLEMKLSRLQISGDITSKESKDQYKNQLVYYLREFCMNNPEYTEDCFGKASVGTYELASYYYNGGRTDLAIQLILDNMHLEQPVVICGSSISSERAKELGIELDGIGPNSKDMKCVKCPFCKKTVDAIVTDKKICCPKCRAEVNRTNTLKIAA
jgi:ssDNA-binding Zn-finger/Zn-ribbon topoisomerase 1